MALYKKLNYATGTLASGIADDAVEVVLNAGHSITTDTGIDNNFIGVFFSGSESSPYQDANREIVDAYRTDTNTFTITRAQEGTSARAWSENDNFMLIASAGVFDEYETELGLKLPVTNPSVTGTLTIPETAATSDLDKFVVLDSGVIKYRTGAEVLSDIGAMTNPMTTAGDVIYGGVDGLPTRLAKGDDGKVLTLAGGMPSWEDAGTANALPLAGGTMTGGITLATGTTTVFPLKMVAGTNLTTPVAGVFEFDGTNLYFSI